MAADGSVVIEIKGDSSKLERTLSSLAGTAVKGLATAIAGASAAVSGLAGAAAKVGATFEASMSQVAATMGMTTEEITGGSEAFDLLTSAAKDAGATTAFSASEAAQALNYLALAGYDAQKAADALPAVLNLAAAGGLELAYASDLATDAMAALGIEASSETLTRFGDEMARTASKANTSVAQLGEAILTVGGTAKGLAGGTVELNAALGVLANRGIKGSEGGTALRNVILALSAPTDQAAKSLHALGVEVYDAAGNMRPLNEVFHDLDASMVGMTEGEKTQALNKIFNKVDLKSAQAMLAGCGEEFDNLSAAIANSGGAMQDMADTQLDNLNGDLTILKSGLESLGIAAYESMQGPFRSAVQLATGMVGEIADALKQDGLTGAVEAVGGVLAQAATELTNAAPQMVEAGVMLLSSLVSGLTQNLPALAEGAVSIIASLTDGFFKLLPELYAAALPMLAALAEGIAQALPTLVPAAVDAMSTIWNTCLDNLDLLVDAGINLLLALAEGLIEAVPKLLAKVPEIVTKLVRAIVDNAPKLLVAAGKLILSLLKGIWNSLPQLGKAAGEIVKAVADGILELLGRLLEMGKNIVLGVWDGIKSMGTWLKDKVTGFFSGVVDGVKGFLGIHSPSKVFARIGENTIEGFVQGVQERERALKETMQAAADMVMEQMPDKADARDAMDGFVSAYNDNLGSIVDGAEQMAADLSKTLEGVEGAWDAVAKKQDAMTKKLAGQGALFSKEDGQYSLSNLNDEVDALTRYADMLDALREKEIPQGLLDDLLNMDMDDALGYGEQLLSQTDGQWEAYLSAWEAKQALAKQIAEDFYKDQLRALEQEYNDRLEEGLGALQVTSFACGQDTVAGLIEGMAAKEGALYAKARQMANNVASQMRAALDIHSPSRKMRDRVGAPAAQGLIAGFEDELRGWGARLQATVGAQTDRLAAAVSVRAAGAAPAPAVTREIHNTTRTVERVARIEGDGITDELVRLLGLRLRDEDWRAGTSLA